MRDIWTKRLGDRRRPAPCVAAPPPAHRVGARIVIGTILVLFAVPATVRGALPTINLIAPATAVVLGARSSDTTALETNDCALLKPGSDTMTTRDCVSCHQNTQGSHNHAVDVDYAYLASRPRSGLRPLAEVVKRGLLLVDDKVSCTTCHERRSTWKYHLAIPPGAAVHPAVIVGDPSTYDPAVVAAAQLQPGADVGRKPLCLSCHSFD